MLYQITPPTEYPDIAPLVAQDSTPGLMCSSVVEHPKGRSWVRIPPHQLTKIQDMNRKRRLKWGKAAVAPLRQQLVQGKARIKTAEMNLQDAVVNLAAAKQLEGKPEEIKPLESAVTLAQDAVNKAKQTLDSFIKSVPFPISKLN